MLLERAKRTSTILNHNCLSLLVRHIHGRKASVSLLCLTSPPVFLSLSFSLEFSPCLTIALFLVPSGILLLVLSFSHTLDSPLLVGNKRSSATVAIVDVCWWELNYHNFVLFIPRGKKEDNFWWKRNNFIGRCYVRSVGVYCRCALHLFGLCASIRNGTKCVANVSF